MTTLGDLLRQGRDWPANLPLLVPIPDHAYRPAAAHLSVAAYDEDSRIWSQVAGDEQPGDYTDLGLIHQVLIVD